MVILRASRRVHQLDGEIDALCRSIGGGERHDVLLAQDRHLALDEQPRALIDVGDDAIADDHAFVRFELYFQRHGITSPLHAHGWRGELTSR
jgi:hypothetical protein